MKSVCILAASLAAIALPAAAQADLTRATPAYTYYHRAGADLATHDAELIDCVRLAAQAVPYSVRFRQPRIPFSLPDLMNNAERRQGIAVNTENCMVVKGWEVVTLSDASGKKIMDQTIDEVRVFLAPRVGEPVVALGIARAWGNEAADPETKRTTANGDNSGKPSISIRGLGDGRIFGALGAPIPIEAPIKPLELRLLDSGGVARIPAGSAVIVTRVRSVSFENDIGFRLTRNNVDRSEAVWSYDGEAASMGVYQRLLGAKPEGKFFAAVVPAGEWRMESIGFAGTLNFCLGAPSFRIEPGEVIFAGTFDMGGVRFAPDMEMIAARKFLKSRPDLADQMRPARWRNGSIGLCGDNGIYALEFPGAPFAEGYEWGSARKAAAPAS